MKPRDVRTGVVGPVETRTVAIPVSLFIRGLQLVERGRFDTFDSAVAAGLELLTRSGTASPNARRVARTSHSQGVHSGPHAGPSRVADAAAIPSRLPHVQSGTVPTSDRGSTARSAWPILGFTASRLLPMKAVLRGIAEMAAGQSSPMLDLEALRSSLGAEAIGWRAALEAVDDQRRISRGERLATGFPSFARDGERSVRRFMDTYLGTLYSDGRAAGAPAYLGFVDMEMDEHGGRVGLTPSGLRFAQLPNGVLDVGEARFPPFGAEETGFFVRHLAGTHLAEAEHVGEYLVLLTERPGVQRDAACSAMRRFYVRFWAPNDLTADMVNSMRMSVHSRCQELGLAVAEHEGRSAGYRITELGARTLGLLQSLKSTPGEAET